MNVIVINAGAIPVMESEQFFDAHGIIRGDDYTLYEGLCNEVMEAVRSRGRLLIFTSHNSTNCDSLEVARRIKAENPNAIVFALTRTPPDDFGELDGIINKDRFPNLPADIVMEFWEDVSREALVAMTRC
jgi:hypothetical protein